MVQFAENDFFLAFTPTAGESLTFASITVIYLQVKWPGGKKFEDKVVETLKKYGYGGSYLSKKWLKKPLFIQSFAPTSLVYISNLTDSPKVLLIDDVTMPTQDTNQVNALLVVLFMIPESSFASIKSD